MDAPDDLGADGAALWSRMASWLSNHPDGATVMDAHELAILAEACRVADRLALLREALDGADLTDAATMRMLTEERLQRGTLATLLVSKLGLPTGLADDADTPLQRRGQAAARARWGDRREAS